MVSRNRKDASKTETKPTQMVEIPEEEQLRLIQESGILNRINPGGEQQSKSEALSTSEDEEALRPLAEEIFNALVIIMPLTFFLIMMDILIHHQYAKQPGFRDIVNRLVNTFPIMSIFMFYTIRHKENIRTQIALFLLSLGVGPRMIWLVNRGSWLTNIAQCPQLATAWLYTVIQLNLPFAVLSLTLIGAWTWWSGMKLLL